MIDGRQWVVVFAPLRIPYGPFDSAEAATAWADAHPGDGPRTDLDIRVIEPPDSGRRMAGPVLTTIGVCSATRPIGRRCNLIVDDHGIDHNKLFAGVITALKPSDRSFVYYAITLQPDCGKPITLHLPLSQPITLEAP